MHTNKDMLLGWFIEPPQVRQDLGTPEELQQLADSMDAEGQLQEVIALPSGELVAGFRRLAAAKLSKTIKTLRVRILENATPKQIRVIQLTENLHRKGLSDVELYHGCKALLEEFPRRVDLAAHLHKSPSWVTTHLSPDDVVPVVREAFLAGQIESGAVYKISQFPEAEQAAALALRLNGASKANLAEHRRRIEAEGRQAVKKSRCKLALPSVTLTVSGSDMGLEDLIESLQAALDAARKASRESLDIKTFERVLRDKNRRAGHA